MKRAVRQTQAQAAARLRASNAFVCPLHALSTYTPSSSLSPAAPLRGSLQANTRLAAMKGGTHAGNLLSAAHTLNATNHDALAFHQMRFVSSASSGASATDAAPDASSSSSSFAASSAASSSPAQEKPPLYCPLCDAASDTAEAAAAHRRSSEHLARAAVARHLTHPARGRAISAQLSRHIPVSAADLQAQQDEREGRRRRRLRASLLRLRGSGVLHDCLPETAVGTAAATPGERGTVTTNASGDHQHNHTSNSNTTSSSDGVVTGGGTAPLCGEALNTCAVLGAAAARTSLSDRVARVLPQADAAELRALVDYLLSVECLARLYTSLDLGAVLLSPPASSFSSSSSSPARTGDGTVGEKESTSGAASAASHANTAGEEAAGGSANNTESVSSPENTAEANTLDSAPRPTPPLAQLTSEEKALLALACVGELARYGRRRRPRSVGSAASVQLLVTHVLADHTLANMLAGHYYDTLQRLVTETTAVAAAEVEAEGKVEKKAATPPGDPALTNDSPSPSSSSSSSPVSGEECHAVGASAPTRATTVTGGAATGIVDPSWRPANSAATRWWAAEREKTTGGSEKEEIGKGLPTTTTKVTATASLSQAEYEKVTHDISQLYKKIFNASVPSSTP